MVRKQASETAHPELRLAGLLVQAADADTVFRDLYLERAATYLAGVFPEAEYRGLGASQSRVDALLRQTQAAVRREDWAKVKELSAEADALRQALREKAAISKLAASVYDARSVAIDPFSPGLAAFLEQGASPAKLRQALIASLGDLVKADPEWSELYAERLRHFENLVVAAAEPKAGKGAKKELGLDELREQARAAAERGEVGQLQRLADEIVRATAAAKAESGSAKAEAPSGAAAIGRVSVSTEPFPADCLARATSLGLEHVQMKAQFEQMPAVLSDFVSQYAWRPEAPTEELASEGAIRLRARLDELTLPRELVTPFVELAALFVIRPFVTSGGSRYFVPDAGEYVLLETFSEDGEPPKDSELLTGLGLSRRRALSRVEIEQALRHRGGVVLRERLGLDPRVFRIVCVPYDVYVRAGSERGWGRQPQWTHVDGYGVQAGRLGALAAGDVRYGGLFDLVILGDTDQREGVVARFCVIRRSRLQVGAARE